MRWQRVKGGGLGARRQLYCDRCGVLPDVQQGRQGAKAHRHMSLPLLTHRTQDRTWAPRLAADPAGQRHLPTGIPLHHLPAGLSPP